MMACVDSIALFFNNSLKHQLCLDKWIVDFIPTTEKHCKLKELNCKDGMLILCMHILILIMSKIV